MSKSYNPYIDLINPTVGELIKHLSEYPDDTKIVFDAEKKGLFTNVYPLSKQGFEVGIYEGQYANTVCIVLKK